MLDEKMSDKLNQSLLCRDGYESLNSKLSKSFTEAHLDIRDYLESEKSYLMNDGDFAKLWEISPNYDEDKVLEKLIEEISEFQKKFRPVVPGIPAYKNQGNVCIQLILSSRRLNEAPPKNVGNKSYEFGDSLVGSFLKAEEEFLFKSLGFRKRRFYLSIRFTPNPDYRTAKEIVVDFFKEKKYLHPFKPEKSLDQKITEIERALNDFLSECKSLEEGLSERGMIRPIEYKEAVSLIQNIVNSGSKHPEYPESENIEGSINCPGVQATPSGVKNQRGGFSDVYFLNQVPSSFAYGNIRHFIDNIPHPDFELVWTLTRGSNKPRNEIIGRMAHFDGKSSKVDIADDFRKFKKSISTFNPYAVCSLRLIAHNPPENFRSKLQNAANDFLYSAMEEESQIGCHMFATSLPMNCNRFSNELRSRSRKMLLDKALAFMPIYDGPPSEHGTFWRLSRALTPTRFSLHEGEDGKHIAVIGTTRAGKSCKINYLLTVFLDSHPKAVIRGIDFKTSYRKLAELVDGKIVKFSEEELRKNPTSPFAIENCSNDDIRNLKILLKSTILIKNPGIHFEDVHDDFLKDALARAFRDFESKKKALSEMGSIDDAPPHPVWENIVAAFPETKAVKERGGVGNLDKVVEQLNRWTISFTQTGDLGFIFSNYQRKSDSELNCRFLVYDLEGIEDGTLRKIATMIASIKINRDFNRLPVSTPKMFLVDELGEQIRGGKSESQDSKSSDESLSVMGQLIVSIATTAAKQNGQLLAITNQVSDYAENKVGEAVWTLAHQKVFLPMGDLFPEAKKKWQKSFNEAEWSIIKSLKKEKSKKRSMYYISSQNDVAPYKGSGYLPLSPYMDALATTSSSQVELYKRLRAEGYQPFEAIEYMATKHPYGEGLEEDPRDIEAKKTAKKVEEVENDQTN